MTDTQPRQSSGVPTGGQFITDPRMEPNTDHLIFEESDEDYNASGTFKYPNPPRSPEQVIAFWRKVPVPDDYINALMDRQNDDIRARINDWVAPRFAAERDRWIAANTKHGLKPNQAEADAAMREQGVRERLVDQARREVDYPYIPIADGRTCCRIIGMRANMDPKWTDEQQRAVVSTPFRTSAGVETAEQIANRLELGRFRTLPFVDPERERLADVMHGVTQRLGVDIEDLRQSVIVGAEKTIEHLGR